MHELTLAEIARGLAAKQFSSEELTRALLARIHQLDPHLNSFISVTDELAIAQARAADARRAQGESGDLLGAPLGHKDLFCTQGVRTSCASRMLDNFKAPYDATVVARLAAAGTVTLGKTNMDEFAMGSANESSWYGAVKNPWNLDHVPGGSSGGSAAAVAARLLPVATATDTGGSIRQPAAFTNLTGIKPTYGRVSRWGMIAYASSLDQGGVLARTAEDCALRTTAPPSTARCRACASACPPNTSAPASTRASPTWSMPASRPSKASARWSSRSACRMCSTPFRPIT
jgi:aspartyl-tRNA(Asn)/glutamyl-tRNA(Gln) amidotransferase subunit A